MGATRRRLSACYGTLGTRRHCCDLRFLATYQGTIRVLTDYGLWVAKFGLIWLVVVHIRYTCQPRRMQVLLSYQLRYGFVEWLNGSLVGAMVSYRMYGMPGLVSALHPLLLVLQLLVYYVLPCAAVWWLESKQRARFR